MAKKRLLEDIKASPARFYRQPADVMRDRRFGEIWADTSDPLMAGLKARPRAISGRCGECRFFDVCGGNTRVRAYRLSGDAFAEDPACYLDDAEIGLTAPRDRLAVTPFRGLSHEPYTVA